MEKKKKKKYATLAVSPAVRDKVRVYAAQKGETVKAVVERAIETQINNDD
jgi:hypothetical protein